MGTRERRPEGAAGAANGPSPGTALLRVERGSPSEEELAALTAVLLARVGALDATAADGCPPREPQPSWRRWERMAVFVNPRAWR